MVRYGIVQEMTTILLTLVPRQRGGGLTCLMRVVVSWEVTDGDDGGWREKKKKKERGVVHCTLHGLFFFGAFNVDVYPFLSWGNIKV